MPATGREPVAEPEAGAGEQGRQKAGQTARQQVRGESTGAGVGGQNCQGPGLAVSLALQCPQQADKL